MLVAAAARWPNLWQIPAFSDETLQARLALAIYRGQAAPLTNYDPYVGAFWNYLVAGGFWLVAPDPWLPRLVSFVAGVATVGATWWLGRELGDRIGAIVAAGFMATNSTHILVNSHVGSSHAIMPLFTTLGFACLVRAPKRQPNDRRLRAGRSGVGNAGQGTTGPDAFGEPSHAPGGWLVAAGAFLGLGVQTHVTAALLLPAAALAVLVCRPAVLRTRWAPMALAAFVLTTANLVVYNVQTGGGTLTGALDRAAEYTGEEEGYDAEGYLANLRRLALGAAWVLSGAIEKRRFVGESLADPLPLLYLLISIGAVLWTARRGSWLPLVAIVPPVLLMPLLNPKYEPLLNGRYLVPLLPFVYAAVGIAAGDGWRALRAWRPAAAGLAAAGLVALAAYPLAPLARYELTTPRTNRAAIGAYQAVLAHRQPDEVVVLDAGLDDILYMGAGSAQKSMEHLLSTSDVPYVVVNARAGTLADALVDGSPRLVVLHGDKAAPLGRVFQLAPLGPAERGAGFQVYRIAARR